MAVPAIEFVEVSRSFGEQFAAERVSFSVAEGECVALIGVNGAGKTTLLRCALDYCRPDGGAVRIHGVDSRQPRARSRLAWLPERFAAPYYLTGRDYLRLASELRGQRLDAEAAAAQLAALDFDVAALARPARTYSKGMNQKLGLAACLLAQRALTVLDEPTSGLDPRARALVRAALAQVRAAGRTLVFSSHSLAEVAALADRVLVMHRARLVFDGTPAQFARHWAAPEAAAVPSAVPCAAPASGEFALEQAFLRCIGATTA